MELAPLDTLTVDNAKESLAMIKGALKKQPREVQDPARNIIALNAGVAIYVAGCVDTIALGIELAQDVMASGAALEKLGLLRDYTSVLKD